MFSTDLVKSHCCTKRVCECVAVGPVHAGPRHPFMSMHAQYRQRLHKATTYSSPFTSHRGKEACFFLYDFIHAHVHVWLILYVFSMCANAVYVMRVCIRMFVSASVCIFSRPRMCFPKQNCKHYSPDLSHTWHIQYYMCIAVSAYQTVRSYVCVGLTKTNKAGRHVTRFRSIW